MERIGRYQIISPLGRGAMGLVYRALDPKIGRELALKTIKFQDHADPGEIGGLRERLFREAQSAGQLSHPGIVTIFDADEQDGLAYITMELVEGRNLADSNVIDLPFVERLQFVGDFLAMAGSAIDYAHSKGVVHRDLKPSNIMITDRGIKIMDFGVARIASSELTQTGTVIGTPNYMSPEQVRGSEVDGRSDQFSLGVIVYELLTTKKPFDGGNLNATLYKLANEDPPFPQRLNPAVTPSLGRVLMRSLAKSPDDRFDSCGAFAAAFGEAAGIASEPSPGREAGRPPARLPDPVPARPDWSDTEADETTDDFPLPTASAAPRRLAVRDPQGAVEPPPALPVPGEPPARWPMAIFVMLLVALGALAALLVRYPGLLDDPSVLLGTTLATDSPAAARQRDADDGLEDRSAPTDAAQPPRLPMPASPPAEVPHPEPAVAVDLPVVEGSTEPVATEPPDEGGAAADHAPPDLSGASPDPAVEAAGAAAPNPGPGTGRVFFESAVAGVLVTVDQNRAWRCVTPCELKGIPVGEHKVVAMLSGHNLQSRTINVGEEGLRVDLRLERVETVLFVSSEPPGARIYVDGRDTGKFTNTRVDVSPGRQSLRLVRGELSAERTFEVVEGSIQRVEFRLGSSDGAE